MTALKELNAICDAATPGPWETDCETHDVPHQDIRIMRGTRSICKVWIDDACYDENPQQENNANFIAQFNPAYILKLLAVVEIAKKLPRSGLAGVWGDFDKALANLEIEP